MNNVDTENQNISAAPREKLASPPVQSIPTFEANAKKSSSFGLQPAEFQRPNIIREVVKNHVHSLRG